MHPVSTYPLCLCRSFAACGRKLVIVPALGGFLLLPAAIHARDITAAVEKCLESVTQSYQKRKLPTIKKNLAVGPITASAGAPAGSDAELTVRELILQRAADSLVFRLVERERLDKLLAEQALQQSGATSEKDQVKAGRLLNAHAYLHATVSTLGEELLLSIRLIDIESGEVFSSQETFDRQSLVRESERLEEMLYLSKYGVGLTLNFLGATLGGERPGFSEHNTKLLRPLGIELKYRFSKYFTAGVGMNMVIGSFLQYDSYPYTTAFSNVNPSAPVMQGGKMYVDTTGFGGISLPVTFYFVYPFTRRFNSFAFFSAEPMLIPNTEAVIYEPRGGIPAGSPIDLRNRNYEYRFKSEGYALNFGLGAEYYVLPRLALSLRAYYSYSRIHVRSRPEEVEVNMSGLGFAPAVSLYF